MSLREPVTFKLPQALSLLPAPHRIEVGHTLVAKAEAGGLEVEGLGLVR